MGIYDIIPLNHVYNMMVFHRLSTDCIKEETMYQPLADKIRPTELDDMVGQEHIIGKDGFKIERTGGKKA